MDPELKHLRYFVAVAETLSFTAAARSLYVSQQAVSRIIQQLERELGVRLLDRTTRTVELTAAGRALLASAKRSIATVEDAFAEARRDGRNGLTRPLRVDLSSAGLRTPAMILRRMRRDHRRVPLHLLEDGVPRGLVALQEGRLDALLGLATACPPSIRSELIRHEPVLLAMAPSHRLARLDAVPVAQLAGAEMLLPTEAAAAEWVDFVHRFCAQAGVLPRRWPGATHGSAAAADVLRELDVVTPTAEWADPPADLIFRPLVDPTPALAWSIMISPVAEGRAELDLLLQAVRAVHNDEE
ncbi:LysR family transcriptional regulator [Pseudonocardia adelaidensis]|uniref:LysR family transcriptional regulator StgR n=1 Tax=Pseudonocardia adelaidensis TaxID=648754 RepID=A0ABP9P6E0_9PSEU